MNVQEQIKEWCKDGRFLRYANERMRKEITEVAEKGESAQTRYLVGIRAGHDAGPLRACLFR